MDLAGAGGMMALVTYEGEIMKITGVNLRTDGQGMGRTIDVSIEVDGEWIRVIREPTDHEGEIDHYVTESGMKKEIDEA